MRFESRHCHDERTEASAFLPLPANSRSLASLVMTIHGVRSLSVTQHSLSPQTEFSSSSTFTPEILFLFLAKPDSLPLPLLHHLHKILEQIVRVVRAGRSFRVILHAE